MSGNELSEEEIKKLRAAIDEEVGGAPPTIGLVGVSGVGKSSTINTLFKTKLPPSDTVACTKEFRASDMRLAFSRGQVRGQPVRLRVIDAPGLGEDIRRDYDYLAMYNEHLKRCDVVLWIMTARNRAIALDQKYLSELKVFHDRMVFAINQVDLVEPMNWNERINLPSDAMLRNISAIEKDRKKRLENYLVRKIRIVSFSARRGYNLETLFSTLLDAGPPKRRWLFDGLKNFKFTDFLPDELRDEIGPIKEED